MPLENAARFIIKTESHRRIGLQFLTDGQPVQVHPRHQWHFRDIIGFGLDDGSQHRHLLGRQVPVLGQGAALIGPESIPRLFLRCQDLFRRCRPVNLIGIGQQQRKDILRRESKRGQQFPVAQGGMHRSGIQQQLVGDFPGDGAF